MLPLWLVTSRSIGDLISTQTSGQWRVVAPGEIVDEFKKVELARDAPGSIVFDVDEVNCLSNIQELFKFREQLHKKIGWIGKPVSPTINLICGNYYSRQMIKTFDQLRKFSMERHSQLLWDDLSSEIIVRNLVNQAEARRDQALYGYIAGYSEAMREAMELIEAFAELDSTILLVGETGTGKTMIAKAIHNISGKEGKFVSVNLANSTPDLARSELFGHAKGAFTDAITEKEGSVGSAKGGTLFLDELGNAPTEIFPLLLQLVEEKTYQRVGDNKTFKLEARIIVSSNKELEPLVEDGVFPRDLYYRIKNVPIYLPSLRQRTEDLELFVNHFVVEFLQPGQPFKILSADVMEKMQKYSWPGNIRELRGEIEHACGRSKNEKVITFKHLERGFRGKLVSTYIHDGKTIENQPDTDQCFPNLSNLPSDFSSRNDDEIAEQLNPYGHTDFTIQGEHLITLMRALLYCKGAIDPASKLLKRAGFTRNSGVERIKNALGKNGQGLVVDEFQEWYFKSFPNHSLTKKLNNS